MTRNAERKSVVDIARLMNAVNSTNNNRNATTSSNGVTVGTILFMVLMAAGLDPMTEKRIADDDNKRYAIGIRFCEYFVIILTFAALL